MNLEFTAEDLDFRDEVRAFLKENLTDELRAGGRMMTSVFVDPEFSLPWQRILHEKGWVAPHWPVEYGGTGWTEVQRYIYAAESALASAPPLAPMSLSMVGPCIIGYGTDEQKAHYLPRILSGEDYWCQGYSEPQSGSDLASLSLRAVSDGDDYILNGSKIWTTHAHFANKMFCLVRTKADGKPQEGITFLLLDMDTPGIQVDPIITLAGDHEVNQVFFTDVRVPKSGRLGEENDGWSVAKYLLEFERSGGSSAGLEVKLARVSALLSDVVADKDALKARLSEAASGLQAIKVTEQRVLSSVASGKNPGPIASMLKILRTEMTQQIDTLAMETAGSYAVPLQTDARMPGSNIPPVGPSDYLTIVPSYLNNRAASIYGGSNEVQRNIMAKAVLGL